MIAVQVVLLVLAGAASAEKAAWAAVLPCADPDSDSCRGGDEQVALLQQTARAKARIGADIQIASAASNVVADTSTYQVFGIPVFLVLSSFCALWLLNKGAKEIKECAPYIAEFLGTFALVFTVGCCVITGSGTWNALAIASVLMIMVYATGPISGGHLNPAVSLSLVCCGKMELSVMLGYWVAQVTAGIAAACCYGVLLAPKTAVIAPVAPFEWWHALIVEVIYTAMLCFVVNNCAASKRNNAADDGNQFFALAIGFVIVAGGYAAGGISGAAFNPAVSLGLDLASNDSIGWGFVWTAFEAIGAILAAGLFRLCRPEDYVSEEELRDYKPTLATKCLSEFLGVFILVLTVGLNLVMASVATAFSAAAALMCMIYSLGDVSGAHFNPAVTLAVVLSGRGKCDMKEGVLFLVTQLCAGISAGALYSYFHYCGPNKDTNYALAPGPGYRLPAAGVAELVFTFVLCYVVLATATVKAPPSQLTKQNFFFALCIGQSVTVGGFAIGAVSGGELNPAVATGISIASTIYSPSPLGYTSSFGYVVYFAAWELAGGILASLIFRLTHPLEFGNYTWAGASKYICEFVGTFVLVFTIGCNVICGSATWTATSIACALMVMIYCTGPISGGNLNPCVSLALVLCGKLDVPTMLGYWVAQISAGITAGFCFCGLFSPRAAFVEPVSPYTWHHAFIVETIYTAMLCFVVLNCAGSKRNNSPQDGNNFFALAIGFVIVAGGYAAGGISGAAFNPAVALGLDISSVSDRVGWGFAWTGFEVIGAVVAAALFRICRPEDFMSELDFASYVPSLLTKCVSEFLGVFILVLTVGLNVVNASTATAWSAAAALMCMIYSLGDVSGAHFNPAVTLAVTASGRGLCLPAEGIAYVMCQMAAGICAGLVYAVFHLAGPNSGKLYALMPGASFSDRQGLSAELIFTGALAYTVLSCATVAPASNQKTKNSFYFALCIGSAVTVGGFAIGAMSGGELNPAVSAGISMASAVSHPEGIDAPSFTNLVKFGAWELTGGLLAAVAFQLTHAGEYAAVEKA